MSILLNKNQDYKDGYSDGFRLAWHLLDKQSKIVLEAKDHEIELLRKQVKADSVSTLTNSERITLND